MVAVTSVAAATTISYLASAISQLIVMLAGQYFTRAGDFARAIVRVSGHGLYNTYFRIQLSNLWGFSITIDGLMNGLTNT